MKSESKLSYSSISSDPWRSFALDRAGLYHNIWLTTYAFITIFVFNYNGSVVVSRIQRNGYQPGKNVLNKVANLARGLLNRGKNSWRKNSWGKKEEGLDSAPLPPSHAARY